MATTDDIATIAADLPPLISRARAADVLDLCERTIDRMIARGEIETVRVAHRVRIPRASLERLLRSGVL